MVELHGNLGGIGLPAIVQLLGELRETGRLRLSNSRWAAELSFEDGALVGATFGNEHGVSALDAALLTLTEAEFAFDGGGAPSEHNLELSTDELRVHMAELAERRGGIDATIPSLDAVPSLATNSAGEVATPVEHVVLERSAVQMLLLVDGKRSVRDIVGTRPLLPAMHDLSLLIQQGLITIADPRVPQTPDAPPEPAALAVAAPELLGACPRLGFADDPSRHYSRPTALHRCFASGTPGVVSSQEQRELCLGGRYATCARFLEPAPLAPVEVEEPEQQPVIPASPAPPRGVAARLAVAAQMGAGPPRPEPVLTSPVAGRQGWRERTGRWPLLVATGVLVGLLLVGWTVGLLPMLRRSPTPTAVIPSPGLGPALAASPAPTSAGQPRVAIASPTALARPATSISVPKPTSVAAEVRGQTLMDTRFAGEVQADWTDNAPFALLRDGAYRLASRQESRFVALAAPVEPLEKVLVSATLRKTGGPPGGGYGLIVRDQGPEPRDGANQEMRAYVLEAGDLGEYGIWRREGDRWVDLVPWTRSAAVRSGGSPNELMVRVDGSVMTFSINGIEVASVDDTELPVGGKVGVFVGGDFNEVALDRFLVLIPD